MVDVSSFLSDGAEIPEGSALKATQSETVLPPWYTNYAMDTLAAQQAVAARPFQAYVDASGQPIQRFAGFTPDQEAGFAATREGAFVFRPELGTASQQTQNVFGRSGYGVAQPSYDAAGQLISQSTAPTGLSTATPYAQQAAQTAPANVQQYMNPYQEAVVDRIGQLAQRNLSESIMPGIEGRYIQAGQLGFGARGGAGGTPSGMMTDTARAIRDTQEATLAAQSQALQQGYTGALSAAQADLARQAQLASTMGGLGTQQQQALLSAGRSATDLGTSAASTYGADTANQLAAAQQMASLAQQRQSQELAGAGALQAVGAQQQALNQQNLDFAREEFMRAQAYPQQQINAMASTFGGVAAGVPTGTQEVGIVPVGDPDSYSPSTAATIAGLVAGGLGLYDKIKGG